MQQNSFVKLRIHHFWPLQFGLPRDVIRTEGEKWHNNRDQLKYPSHNEEVLLILLQVRKGNDSLPDSLDIDFIDYLIEKFADQMVSPMDVHTLIALLDIDDETIYAVQHEFAYIESGLYFFYFGWHYA